MTAPEVAETCEDRNLIMFNALVYMYENRYSWWTLLKKLGNWHTVYVRLSRLAKNNVLKTGLHLAQVGKYKHNEGFSLDSTTAKALFVDWALKKTVAGDATVM
jgi:hypothetical protein